MEQEAQTQIKRTQDADQKRWEAAAQHYQNAKNQPPISVPFSPDTTALDRKIAEYRNLRVTINAEIVDGSKGRIP